MLAKGGGVLHHENIGKPREEYVQDHDIMNPEVNLKLQPQPLSGCTIHEVRVRLSAASILRQAAGIDKNV